MLYSLIRFGLSKRCFSVWCQALLHLTWLAIRVSAAPISPGETVSGNLAVAGAADTWEFSATAGDSVIVRVGEWVLVSDIRPRLQVTAPDGTSAGSVQGFDDAELAFTAKASGLFTIKVDAALASGRGSYRLTMGRVPASLPVSNGDEGGSLLSGELTSGNLYVGDVDFYTVQAEAGDELVFRVGEQAATPDIRPRLRVYGPTGLLLKADQGFDDTEAVVRATNSGPHVVAVDAALAGGSGGYRLSFARSRGAVTVRDGDEGGELRNGELRRGILPNGDLDVYRFSASAGDRLIARVGEAASAPDIRPRLRLYGPNGELLANEAGFEEAEITATATNSGAFLLIVSAGLAGGNGGYALSLARTAGEVVVSEGDEGGPILNGQLAGGNLVFGDLDLWNFTARSGDRIIVRAGENQLIRDIRPRVRLYGPDGALLASDQAFDDAEITATAPTSGSFLIVVSSAQDGGSGSYRLSLFQSTGTVFVTRGDEGGPIANGEIKVGQLVPGDLDVFTFDATVNERFVVRAAEWQLTNDIRPVIRIYGPTGLLFGQVTDFTDAEAMGRATNGGRFTVVVSGGFPGSTGSYRLTLGKSLDELVLSPGDDGGPLPSGALQIGELYPGDVDVWTFDAAPGDNLIVRAGEKSLLADIRPMVRLVGPNGDVLAEQAGFDGVELTAKATMSGRHLIWVSGLFPGAAGTYWLSQVRIPSTQTVSAGDEGGTLRNGETRQASLNPGDVDVWTFTGSPDQRILVRVGEVQPQADIRPHVRLYGPSGQLMAEETGFDAVELQARATLSGLHTLVISGALAISDGGYQVHLLQMPGTVFTAAGDEGGLVTGGSLKSGKIAYADLDPWLFTGCHGDPLTITARVTSGAGGLVPWLRLFGRDGNLLASRSGASPLTLTATTPADGTYLLVLSDGNGSGMGSGDYEIEFGGLSAGVKLCRPHVAGGQLTLTGAGAEPGQRFVLATSLDLNLPSALWSPVLTNVFGQFGELLYQTEHRKDSPPQYYLLRAE